MRTRACVCPYTHATQKCTHRCTCTSVHVPKPTRHVCVCMYSTHVHVKVSYTHTTRMYMDERAFRLIPTRKSHACRHTQKHMMDSPLYARQTHKHAHMCALTSLHLHAHCSHVHASVLTRINTYIHAHEHRGNRAYGNATSYTCNIWCAYTSIV